MQNKNNDWIEDILLKYVDEKLKNQINGSFQDFVLSKSQRDKILFYFIYENNLTNKDLSEIFNDFEINTLTRRLENSKLINTVDKNGKCHIYSITTEGIRTINRKVNSFLEKNYNYKENLMQKRKEVIDKTLLTDNVKEVGRAFFDCQIKPNINDKLIINMKDLAIHNPKVTDFIYNDYLGAFSIIKSIYKEDFDKEIEKEDIIFSNIHESEFRQIHQFDREYKGLIHTKGLITAKKEQIKSKCLNFIYFCVNEDCTHHETLLFSSLELKKSKIKGFIVCPRCKNSLELKEEKRINQLESKIIDVDTGIAFPLYIRNHLVKEFPFLELGDEIEVIGYLEDKVIESKMGIKEIEKVLIVNSFKQTDYIKDLTPEEVHEVTQVLEKYDVYSDYLLKPFCDYIEEDKIKKLFIIQQLTKWDESKREVPLNIAVMGEPGVGKNVLIKTSETYFPNCDGIVGADITDAGFKGTVNRETGIKEVGLAKKCQNGTLFFNEFDKFVKSNPNGKKGASQLLNASITEQEIRLNKAGIRIRMSNLDLRHNIIFNPLDEKVVNKDRIPYDMMGELLDKSLLSRMLPVYINKDINRSKKVFDLMLSSKENIKKPNPETYKLVIRYLRGLDVDFTDKAKILLQKIYGEFIKEDKFAAISVERIGQMLTQLSKGISRLNGKSKCGVTEVKEAHEVYMFALKSVGINMTNLEALTLDRSVDDITQIVKIKKYITESLIKSSELTIKELYKMFDMCKSENLDVSLKQLYDSKEYIELPKGIIRNAHTTT